jgi:GTPase
MSHKSGFVNIIGNPNVGKSTLMNALVGEKLSIVTSKAQTTRHRIMGIISGEDYQVVYSDTPGILKPHYKLQEVMMKFVTTAMDDADVILFVTEIGEPIEKSIEVIEKLKESKAPVILVINKVDLTTQEKLEVIVQQWKEVMDKAVIIPVSAIKSFNTEAVFKNILDLLPEAPPYFPKDTLTDKTERFFVEEIVREKIMLHYKQEIPYSVEIKVESFVESEGLIKISTLIFVEKESQKGIIIGSKGLALKRVGTEARKDMETFFGKKVFIELFVKVKKDWRNDDRQLKYFGYNS